MGLELFGPAPTPTPTFLRLLLLQRNDLRVHLPRGRRAALQLPPLRLERRHRARLSGQPLQLRLERLRDTQHAPQPPPLSALACAQVGPTRGPRPLRWREGSWELGGSWEAGLEVRTRRWEADGRLDHDGRGGGGRLMGG
jgi:hypothetical protein